MSETKTLKFSLREAATTEVVDAAKAALSSVEGVKEVLLESGDRELRIVFDKNVLIIDSILEARLEASGIALQNAEPAEKPLGFSAPVETEKPSRPPFAPSLPILGQTQPAPRRRGAQVATRWIGLPYGEKTEKEAKQLEEKLKKTQGVLQTVLEPKLFRIRCRVRVGEVDRESLQHIVEEPGTKEKKREVLIVSALNDSWLADRLQNRYQTLPGVSYAAANPASGLAMVQGGNPKNLLQTASRFGLRALLRGQGVSGQSALHWFGALFAFLALLGGLFVDPKLSSVSWLFAARLIAILIAVFCMGTSFFRYPFRGDGLRYLGVFFCLVAAFFLSPTFYLLEIACAILLGMAASKTLLPRFRAKSARPLFSLIQRVSLKTRVEKIRDGNTIRKEVEEAETGDVVVVRAGEIVPVDGPVIRGRAELKAFDAFSKKPLRPGGIAFAGQAIESGEVAIRTLAKGEQTFLARLILRAEEVRAARPSVHPVLQYLPFLGVLLAIGIGILFLLIAPIESSLVMALGTLTLFAPQAFRYSQEFAYATAVSNAASLGFLVKDIDSLVLGAKASYIVLDRSGALRRGEYQVTEVAPLHNVPEDTLLRYATGATLDIPHPIAEALREYARQSSVEPPEPEMQDPELGKGVLASVLGRAIYVGSSELLEDNNISPSPLEEVSKELNQEGKDLVYVAIDRKLSGLLAVEDRPRPGAKAAIKALKKMGLCPVLLSGGDAIPTRVLANTLGITEYHSALASHRKPWEPESLREEGFVVAAVGDAEEDAPLLSASDVSIAFHSFGDGLPWSFETTKQTLKSMVEILSLAKQAQNASKSSLFVVIFYQFLLLVVMLTGLIPVALVVFLGCLTSALSAFFAIKAFENPENNSSKPQKSS